MKEAESEFFRKKSEVPMEQIAEELVDEIQEWTSALERSNTPEERSKLVAALVLLSKLERNLDFLENLHRKSIDLKDSQAIKEAEETITVYHMQVNKIRSEFGLPPKYTEPE